MSAVSPSRLRARRVYHGFLYATRDAKARAVEMHGWAWRDRLRFDGLTLHTVTGDPGCLHAMRGAELIAEIYEDRP